MPGGVKSSGVYRKVGAGASGTWSLAYSGDNVMKGLDGTNVFVTFSWGGGTSKMVYLMDRDNGVFRSLDGGASGSWIKITAPSGGWVNNSSSKRGYAGCVAVDPTNPSRCYVTSTAGVFFSSDADNPGQPTFNPVSISGMQTPGMIQYDDAGNVYVISLVNGATRGKLFYKGAGDSSWSEIATDNTFKAMCGLTVSMSIGPSPDRKIYICGESMGNCVGSLTSTPPPPPPPPPSGEYVIDFFDRASFVTLDSVGADNELIGHSANASAGALSSQFNWGGLNNGSGATVAFGANGALQFNGKSVAAGTRAYTRFDTSANSEAATATTQFNNPSRTVDCTNGVCVLDLMSQLEPNLQMALLVRDNQDWWESNPQSIATGEKLLEISLSTLTWTKVDTSTGGGADMDEVDNKGELTLAYSGSGAPAFDSIEGMGLIIKAPVTTASNAASVDSMSLGQVPKPLNLVAVTAATQIDLTWDALSGVSGYSVYRATTSGGPYTKLTTTALGASTTTYSDTTALPGQTCHYVIRGLFSSPGATNPASSAKSNEVSASVGTDSSVKGNWARFE